MNEARTLEDIGRLFTYKAVHYADVPLHLNIGDLLIFHATLNYFSQYKIKIESYCCEIDYGSLTQNHLQQCGAIFMHGGGNFGDLYPIHNDLRVSLTNKFNHQIIVLPQTIYFKNKIKFEKIIKNFNSQRILVFVRDKESKSVANDHKINTFLQRDMFDQYGLGFEIKIAKQSSGHINLLRSDIEALDRKQYEKYAQDWSSFLSPLDYMILRSTRFVLKLRMPRNINFLVYKLWIFYTKYLVKRVGFKLSGFQTCHSDRLHAILFCSYLGIPFTFGDNDYGKLSRYMNAWKAHQ